MSKKTSGYRKKGGTHGSLSKSGKMSSLHGGFREWRIVTKKTKKGFIKRKFRGKKKSGPLVSNRREHHRRFECTKPQ